MSNTDNESEANDDGVDVLHLGLPDAAGFAKALISPPQPNKRALKAAERYLATR
jgi:hypothetical protein